MPWDRITQEKYKRPSTRYESDLTDGEWSLIEPLVPPPSRLGHPRKTDMREVFNAIQYMLATGCHWRAFPKCFPPFTTIQNYFYAWRDSGLFERMLDTMREFARKVAGRDPEPTAAVIDSQSVKTTESGGPAGYDAGKKVRGRKRHIATDTEGSPITMRVHEASVQDRDGAPEVIEAMLEKVPGVRKLWADGGYQGPKLREKLEKCGIAHILEIVEKPRDIREFTVLNRRWVVERTFAWIGRCRRLSKDYERTIESSLAWTQLAACRFLLRRVARATSV